MGVKRRQDTYPFKSHVVGQRNGEGMHEEGGKDEGG
jgi:hypothetical protein